MGDKAKRKGEAYNCVTLPHRVRNILRETKGNLSSLSLFLNPDKLPGYEDDSALVARMSLVAPNSRSGPPRDATPGATTTPSPGVGSWGRSSAGSTPRAGHWESSSEKRSMKL